MQKTINFIIPPQIRREGEKVPRDDEVAPQEREGASELQVQQDNNRRGAEERKGNGQISQEHPQFLNRPEEGSIEDQQKAQGEVQRKGK